MKSIKSIQKLLLLAVISLLMIIATNLVVLAQSDTSLPELKTYPLPESLENYRSSSTDNYFSQIQTHKVGSLIWTEFPIQIYVESPADDLSISALEKFKQWQKAVQAGIDLWRPYLTMTIVEESENADILIYYRQPELKIKLNPETGLYDLPRVKAATTRIQFSFTRTDPPQLKHQMTIEVNPRQTYDYLVSNIAHELGHALGVWGHSENPKDIMYFAHTRDIPPVSDRDVNTLKMIYQQPTRLGGFID